MLIMENTQKPKMTPKDFFMQFGALVTLYVSVGAFFNLLFTLIDRTFPDALDTMYYYSASVYSSGMRFAIASLVIIFPTYLILLWLMTKESDINPEKKSLGLRRWLTYLTLFVSAGFALGDLVTLLNYFLGGEITTRFILKVLVVLVVSVGIFIYYIIDLRKQTGALKNYKIYAIVSAVIILASIIFGFTVMGLPQSQRAQRFDITRVDDLRNIQNQIERYYQYQKKGSVPDNLATLAESSALFGIVPKDPESNVLYQYEKLGPASFKLCATFGTVSTDSSRYLPSTNQNWQHDKGNVCFTHSVDTGAYSSLDQPTTK